MLKLEGSYLEMSAAIYFLKGPFDGTLLKNSVVETRTLDHFGVTTNCPPYKKASSQKASSILASLHQGLAPMEIQF